MTLFTKICGINSQAALQAAIDNGADMVGFVFYPPSPRNLDAAEAAALIDAAPPGIDRVGVFVDPTDAQLADVLGQVRLDLLQLHGDESPKRVGDLRDRFRIPLIKAIKISSAADLDAAKSYEDVADWLLFDARPPSDQPDALPGGNAIAFDWRLLAGRRFRRPWLLSGGLNAGNLAKAAALSGALAVDVSSGVERGPGKKDPGLIKAFLDAAKSH